MSSSKKQTSYKKTTLEQSQRIQHESSEAIVVAYEEKIKERGFPGPKQPDPYRRETAAMMGIAAVARVVR